MGGRFANRHSVTARRGTCTYIPDLAMTRNKKDAHCWTPCGGGVEFLVLVFDLNFQIGGLDVDRFGRFTDHTSNTVEDLRSSLQLPFL